MNWLLFLHWYQPHNQKSDILTRVVKQSYLPVIKLLKKHARVKVNININGCLTEQLAYQYPIILDELKNLVLKKQIELLASAKHHAFLPLISEKEINRQIKLGVEANQRYFGKKMYKPQGFFPTELAYEPKIYQAVKKNNFKYLLVDELSVAQRFNHLDWTKYYSGLNQANGLSIIPVNRYWSNQLRSHHKLYIGDWFWFTKQQFKQQNKYLISANDIELFGHHYPERIQVLKRAFQDQQINFFSFSEYLNKAEQPVAMELIPATWETTEEDIKSDDISKQLPYPLWHNPKNQLQMLQWELAWLAIANLARFPKPEKDPDWKWHSARDHLDQGLSSCYWWWSSCRPWWNPDMICDGALHLIKSVRTTNASKDKKLIAERLYAKIIELVWQWHWSGEAQKRIDKFEQQAGYGLYWVRNQPVGWQT